MDMIKMFRCSGKSPKFESKTKKGPLHILG